MGDDALTQQIIDEANAREKMNPEERKAAEVLKWVLGAWCWTSIVTSGAGPSKKKHDFDLVFREKSKEAVEVTQSMSAGGRAFADVMSRWKPDDLELVCYWSVEVKLWDEGEGDTKPRAKKLAKQLKTELPTLMRKWEQALETNDALPEEHRGYAINEIRDMSSAKLANKFKSLRVERLDCAAPEPTDGVGGFHCTEYTGIRSGDDHSLSTYLTQQLQHQINKKCPQLCAARENGYDTTHLFVWLPSGLEKRKDLMLLRNGPSHMLSALSVKLDFQSIDHVWFAANVRRSLDQGIYGFDEWLLEFTPNGNRVHERQWTSKEL